MHLRRWFFSAGLVLGAVGVYRIITQRQSQMAKAPAYAPPTRAPQSPPTPSASRAPAPSSTPATPPAPAAPTSQPAAAATSSAPAASTAATEPVASPEDLRNVVTATVDQQEDSPVAAALATAVAESEQEAKTPSAQPSAPTPVIGNTHKMVYHMETDAHLPMEDNRVYFASEQEALDAGYRKAEPLA